VTKQHNDHKKFHKIFDVAASVIIGIFVVIGTILVVAYAYGYRISLSGKSIEETGVLDVQTSPTNGSLYIGSEYIGKTPKTVGSLSAGDYNISVEKTGYTTWNKTVEIKRQLSTPTYAYLFLSTPIKETTYSSPEKVDKTYISSDNNHVFFISNSTSTSNSTLVTYRLNDYIINRNFWEFSDNPKTLYSIDLTADQDFEITPSYNGAYILLRHGKTENGTFQSTGVFTLINTETQSSEPKQIDLSAFVNNYKITWARDNSHLIFESESDIYSYDIQTGATILLDKKSAGQTLIWATSPFGMYYTVNEISTDQQIQDTATTNPQTTPEVAKPYFIIKSKNLNGTNSEIVLDKIYYQTNAEFIETTDITDRPFTHSLYSTRFCGHITDLYIQPEGKGYIIETEYALYWYDVDTDKYTLVSIGDISVLDFSPDGKKFSYLDYETQTLKIFTLDKTESDHVTKIGSKIILSGLEDIDPYSIKWLQNSNFISFIENSEENTNFNIIDIDGENSQILYSTDPNTTDLEALPIINYSLDKMFIAVASGDSLERYLSISVFNIH